MIKTVEHFGETYTVTGQHHKGLTALYGYKNDEAFIVESILTGNLCGLDADAQDDLMNELGITITDELNDNKENKLLVEILKLEKIVDSLGPSWNITGNVSTIKGHIRKCKNLIK